jgi:hypothetical protein
MTIESIAIYLERFEQKFIPEPNSGCWLWTGARTTGGYGHFRFEGRTVPAHRVAWFLYKERLNSKNIFVCHHCDNPPCGFKGERNGNAVLSNDDVIAIRADKRRASIIAAEYGVTRNHIWRIRTEKYW